MSLWWWLGGEVGPDAALTFTTPGWLFGLAAAAALVTLLVTWRDARPLPPGGLELLCVALALSVVWFARAGPVGGLRRARWAGAPLRVAAAGGPDPPERADHALVLRSWNHLADPAAVASSLARMLRPGGTLLVVDNVAFGLVRSRRQAARAEGGPPGFEHYRNDGAAEAVATVAGTGLTLLDRWDVGPGTSNQWWVRWRKE